MLNTERPKAKLAETDADARGDLRLFLQEELGRRCRQNPAYSLRSFARALGVESSRLSKILRGQRPVSARLAEQLGQRLGLSQREIAAYSVKPAPREKEKSASPRHSYQQLSLDVFESIEDWRHYAILELMKVKGFQAKDKWIARALNISVFEVRAYVERLVRVGLLEVKADGCWRDRSEGFSSHILGENTSTYAHRRSQKKILEEAIVALEQVPIEARDQSSMMMATSAARLAGAKRMIKNFRRDLCEYLEGAETFDSVYQLSVSLFPVAEPQKSKERGKK